jgi:hypothetical protein
VNLNRRSFFVAISAVVSGELKPKPSFADGGEIPPSVPYLVGETPRESQMLMFYPSQGSVYYPLDIRSNGGSSCLR